MQWENTPPPGQFDFWQVLFAHDFCYVFMLLEFFYKILFFFFSRKMTTKNLSQRTGLTLSFPLSLRLVYCSPPYCQSHTPNLQIKFFGRLNDFKSNCYPNFLIPLFSFHLLLRSSLKGFSNSIYRYITILDIDKSVSILSNSSVGECFQLCKYLGLSSPPPGKLPLVQFPLAVTLVWVVKVALPHWYWVPTIK